MQGVKVGIGLVIGAFIALVGGWDVAIEVLLIIMALDIVAGMTRAVTQRDIASDAALRGMAKKFGILMLVALGHQASRLVGEDVIRNATIYGFCITEGVSVIENCAAMKVLVPESLQAFFRQTGEKKFK